MKLKLKEVKARAKEVEGNFSDVDDLLAASEYEAGRFGVIPVMHRFQREELKLDLSEEKLMCHETGNIVTPEEFLVYQPSVSMLDMLYNVCQKSGKTVEPNVVRDYDIYEQLTVCEAFKKKLKPMPGAKEYVAWAANWKQAKPGRCFVAVSSSQLRRIDITLKAIGVFYAFDAIVSAQTTGFEGEAKPGGYRPWIPPDSNLYHCVNDYDGEPKPKPNGRVYSLACQVTGTDPRKCLAIEDSPGGIQSTVNADIGLRIGCTASVPQAKREERREQLYDRGAHWVVDDIRDIPPLFE